MRGQSLRKRSQVFVPGFLKKEKAQAQSQVSSKARYRTYIKVTLTLFFSNCPALCQVLTLTEVPLVSSVVVFGLSLSSLWEAS